MAGSFEEAKLCPKCGNAGDVGARRPSDLPGVDVITITCRTATCRWYDTGWLVSINPDGSIPDPTPDGMVRGEKQFDTKKLLVQGVTDDLIVKINRYAEHDDSIREV
jgi:hypothetical protein